MLNLNTGLPDTSWDERLLVSGGHFLQSQAWARFQSALGNEVLWSSGRDWSWMGIIQSSRAGNSLYCPYGPTIQSTDSAKECQGSLIEAAKHSSADFIRVEPMGKDVERAAIECGNKRVKSVQPAQTWVLDISRSTDELKGGVSAGHRSAVNSSTNRGILITSSSEVQMAARFVELIHMTSERGQFKPHPDNYYFKLADTLIPSRSAKFYSAVAEGETVAMAICFDFGDTRYYAHAAADQDKSRRLQAAVPLVWQMILDAKNEGKTRFDFWGVAPDDNPKHPWAGITKFKQAFGGEMVNYAGTWEMPVHHLKYHFVHLARKLIGR